MKRRCTTQLNVESELILKKTQTILWQYDKEKMSVVDQLITLHDYIVQIVFYRFCLFPSVIKSLHPLVFTTMCVKNSSTH